MSQKPADAALPATEQPGRSDGLLALAFNLGVAMFVLTGIWVCLDGDPGSAGEFWLKLGLMAAAVAVAAPAWIAGSTVSRSLKTLLIGIVLAGTAYTCVAYARDFNRDSRLLEPGKIEQGQFIHEAIGLTFDTVPNASVRLLPQIINRNVGGKLRDRRSQLHFGEVAILLSQAAGPTDPNSKEMSTSVDLRVEPYLFRPVHGVRTTVLELEARYAATKGVEILKPTRVYQRDQLDFAEFDISDEPNDVICRHLFARSGPYLLCFVMISRHGDNRALFDRVSQSIRISRHPTGFLE